MTPKEKAKELINKYRNLNVKVSNFVDDYLFGGDIIIKMKDNQSKQCALIAVDEIQEYIVKYDNHVPDFKYWEEVRKEIEKL